MIHQVKGENMDTSAANHASVPTMIVLWCGNAVGALMQYTSDIFSTAAHNIEYVQLIVLLLTGIYTVLNIRLLLKKDRDREESVTMLKSLQEAVSTRFGRSRPGRLDE